MSGYRWPTLCSRERRVKRSNEKRATVWGHLGVHLGVHLDPARRGAGDSYLPYMHDFRVGSLATIQSSLRWCVRVFSVSCARQHDDHTHGRSRTSRCAVDVLPPASAPGGAPVGRGRV